MYSKIRVVLCALVITAGLGWAMIEYSCSKDPEKRGASVTFSYSINWNQVFNNCAKPEKLRYCFYPVDGEAMLRTDGDASGFKMTLPADKYNVLVFNYDATNIQFKNLESFTQAEAQLITTGATNNNINEEIPLYGLAITNLDVTSGREIKEVLQLSPLLKKISFNIDIEGSNLIKSCKGSLSGVASALNLSKQQVVPEDPITVNIKTTLTGKEAKGSIMILGIATQSIGDEEGLPVTSNKLTLEFTLTDGSAISTTIDLGHNLVDEPLPYIYIDIKAMITQISTVTINSWKITSGNSTTIK